MELFYVENDELNIFFDVYSAALPQVLQDNMIVLGAIDETKEDTAGLAVAEVSDDTLVFRWLYVKEQYRRQGLGYRLLQTIVNAAAKTEQITGVSVIYSKSNDGIFEFLTMSGFDCIQLDDQGQYTVRLGDMKSPVLKSVPRKEVATIKELAANLLDDFVVKLVEKKNIQCGVDLPIKPEEYMDESLAMYDENGISAIILMKKQMDGIEISWVYSSNPIETATIIGASGRRLIHKYTEDAKLYIGTLNNDANRLINTLFHDVEIDPVCIGFWGGK